MKQRFRPMLVVLLGLCCSCAWAQVDTGAASNPVTVQPGPVPAFTYPDATPSLDFLNESIENSSITLGIGTGFSYYQSHGLFNVTPSIKIQQFRSHLAWHINYAGGYQTYTSGGSSTYSNMFSQRAGGGFVWQLAQHWQVLGDDNYIHSANPFDSYLTTPGVPTINNPNPVTYYPLTQYTANQGYLTLTDQLSKADTLSFTGTAMLRNTSNFNVATTVPFYNVVSYGGLGAYSHRMSARLTLGGSYNYNSLDFGRGQQRSGVQTISFTADYLIRPGMTISGWVGPQYTSTKTVVFIPPVNPIEVLTSHDSLWSVAAGANFSWQSPRNAFRAGFFRRVQDGGGLTATSEVNSANATYRRMLAKKWDGLAGINFVHDVSTTSSARTATNLYTTLGLSYKPIKSVDVAADYAFQRVNQSNTIVLGPSNYTNNRVSITASYSWTHPLGR